MKDTHKLADIIADIMTETPNIDGVTMAAIKEEWDGTTHDLNKAIDKLMEVAGVSFRGDAIMLGNKFIYGYRFAFKRPYYDELNGKCIHDKIVQLADMRKRYEREEISVKAYFYATGRVDQNCYTAGYI